MLLMKVDTPQLIKHTLMESVFHMEYLAVIFGHSFLCNKIIF